MEVSHAQTKLPQLLNSMCEEVSFPRSEHKTLLLDYSKGLAISHFKSLSSIGRKMGHSQSSLSRMLSNTRVTTEELTGSRLNFIQNFLFNSRESDKQYLAYFIRAVCQEWVVLPSDYQRKNKR